MKTEVPDIHRQLIEKSLKNDRKAQYELYVLYSRSMFNVCLRMLIKREEAEEALQDAFTEAFRKLDKFEYRSTFGAWLKRIVINTCLNRLRKKDNLQLMPDGWEAIPEEDNETYPENSLSIETILKAVEKLPDGYRTVLNLVLFEGFEHQEVASILTISESTSRTQYHKAKLKLREILNSKP